MKLFFSGILFLAISLLPELAHAQEENTPVSFNIGKERVDQNKLKLIFTATIDAGVKLYALKQTEEDLLYSGISFDSSASRYLNGSPSSEVSPLLERDETLDAEVSFHRDSVRWTQSLNASTSDSFLLKGTINYMYQRGDEYLPATEEFQVFVKPDKFASTDQKPLEGRSLLWIFLTAFAGGLLALITPCVYAMIPVTVSYFTKKSETRAQGIRNALQYATSIVCIFTLLGFLVTLIFGPAALNTLATNWIANLVFFAIFLVFGISFLGAFEIKLPASWSNTAGSRAGKGNFLGIFFMALTLVIVSFSCTGPIIGNLLVLASQGSYWGPLVGMFGFSAALAMPFALFAFFPSKLNLLGKSGGWLNSVKVTLGFLELALALKFLSNADLARGWRFLDREVFLSLWIILFLLLGAYLLGKIRFHHDDELPKNDFGKTYLSVPRLFFAISSLAFATYMFPGLWGAPLKAVSAFLPPMGTQDFNASTGKNTGLFLSSGQDADGLPHPEKYYDQMKMYEPEVVTKYGMITYFDYEEALAVARKFRKPLMLDFTGINCVNCRKMEGQVWSDPQVMKLLQEEFVIASLYVDVHHIDLQEHERFYSEALSKQVNTLGDKYADMQVSRYGANVQPYYFFVDSEEKMLIPEGYGYDPDVNQFLSLLKDASAEYKRRSN